MSELKMSDLIYVKKNMLSPDQCDELIAEFSQRSDQSGYEHSTNANTGDLTDSTFKSLELKPGTNNFSLAHATTKFMIDAWLAHLESFKAFHMHSLKSNLNYSHSYRLLKYEVGSSIHPHVDWDHFVHASCTLNLNEDYAGGEFQFFNGRHSVELKKGDAMVFPADSFWVHEVTPVTQGIRYSVNSFILSMPNELKMKLNHQLKLFPATPNPFGYR